MATSADRNILCKKCCAISTPIDGDSVRCCTQCYDVFGVDDSFDQQDVMQAVVFNDVQKACYCGNNDANEFEFCTQDGACCLKCRLCNQIYVVVEAINGDVTQSFDDGVRRASTVQSLDGICIIYNFLSHHMCKLWRDGLHWRSPSQVPPFIVRRVCEYCVRVCIGTALLGI